MVPGVRSWVVLLEGPPMIVAPGAAVNCPTGPSTGARPPCSYGPLGKPPGGPIDVRYERRGAVGPSSTSRCSPPRARLHARARRDHVPRPRLHLAREDHGGDPVRVEPVEGTDGPGLQRVYTGLRAL